MPHKYIFSVVPPARRDALVTGLTGLTVKPILQSGGRLSAAKSINEQSSGAFDVTVAPLVNLWGFGPQSRSPTLPDSDAIDAARRQVGSDRFQLRESPPALKKSQGEVAFDLSGIAKGYAVDVIAERLRELGLANFLVDIGGEMRAFGTNRRGESWQIGIEDPATGGVDVARTIALQDTGLASSGNYRNKFSIGGVEYGHTINPTTGQPTRHTLLAASVIHPQTMLADAWATALMSMGPEAAQKIARRAGLAAMLFNEYGDSWQITTTAPFDAAIKQR